LCAIELVLRVQSEQHVSSGKLLNGIYPREHL